MIMIMAMIIMRKNEGGTYQRSWKSTPLVMGKASVCGWWCSGGELLRQKLICSLVESGGDEIMALWLSVMREGRLGQYRTLWCWELSGKKIWFISWASWASELPRIGWRSDLTVVSESVRPYKVKWNGRHSCEHLVRTEHWNLFSQQFEIGEHGNTPNTLVACGLQIRKGTDR